MRSRTIFRSTESLARNGDDGGGSMNNAIVAAYNPGMGVNGGAMYHESLNGDYHENLTNLAKSASIHSNVNSDGVDSGFLVVEADVVASQMPVIDENCAS